LLRRRFVTRDISLGDVLLRRRCVYRRFVWRRFVEETFCMCAVLFVLAVSFSMGSATRYTQQDRVTFKLSFSLQRKVFCRVEYTVHVQYMWYDRNV
jgi:hypothetical protein